MTQHNNERLLNSIFQVWKIDFRVLAKIKSEEKKLQELFFIRKRFAIWRKEFMNSQQITALSKTAESHYEKHLLVKYYRIISIFSLSAKHERDIQNYLRLKKNSSLMTSTFKQWHVAFLNNRNVQKRAEIYNLETKRHCFDKWQKFFNHQKEEKLLNARAHRLHEKSLAKYAGILFNKWQAYIKWRKRSKYVLEQWKPRRVRRVYKKVFEELRMLKLRSLKEKHDKLYKEFKVEEVMKFFFFLELFIMFRIE